MNRMNRLFFIGLPLILLMAGVVEAEPGPEPQGESESIEKRCLLVYSYHIGYAWNDGIDRGATRTLGDACTIRRYYMDSKRNPDPEFIRAQVAEVLQIIHHWKPDVIIAADDNASKYLVVPHLKEDPTPVVFCGVNWSIEEYGYPFSSMTGMIEVTPLDPLFIQSKKLLLKKAKEEGRSHLHVVMIDADRITAYKQLEPIISRFSGDRTTFATHYIETFEQWKSAFLQAQQADLVVLSNNAGIQGWNQEEAISFVREQGRTFSVSINDWMRELVVLVMAKDPEEQGEWSAEAAKQILQGVAAETIAVVKNRRWNTFINQPLLEQSGVVLPEAIRKRAIWMEE
ncbi:MAG: hypothetical protein HN842_07960 [Gammaproteobacteria bacterium]|jgi:hypothetical protein|nr:hypothetical protein [Gammaproteobacteria bacterium]